MSNPDALTIVESLFRKRFREVDYDVFLLELGEAEKNGYRIRPIPADAKRLEEFDGGVLLSFINDPAMRELCTYFRSRFGDAKVGIIGRGGAKGLYLYTVSSPTNHAYQWLADSIVGRSESSLVMDGALPRRTIAQSDLERLFRNPDFLKKALQSGKSSAEVFMAASDAEVEKWLSTPKKWWQLWK